MGIQRESDRRHLGEAIRYTALMIMHLRQLITVPGKPTEKKAVDLKEELWRMLDQLKVDAAAGPRSSIP